MVDIINNPRQVMPGSELAINPPFAKRALSRWFTAYSSALNGYDEFSTPFVLTGDYRVRALVYFDGSQTVLYGNSAFPSSRCQVLSDGSVNWRADNFFVSVDSPAATVPTNRLSIIEVGRVGSAGTITVNDATVFSGAVPTGLCEIDVIARQGGTYANAELAALEIEKAGIMVGDFPLDEGPGSTIRINRAAVLGSEFGDSVSLVLQNGTIRHGAVLSASTVGFQDIAVGFGALPAAPVLVNISTTGSGSVVVEGGGLLSTITAGDSVELVSGGTDILFKGTDFTGDIAMSLKEIPAATPYATRFNQPASLTNLFTQVSDGWKGEELWMFGDAIGFNEASTFTAIIGTSFALPLQIGSVYRASGNKETSNRVELRLGGNQVPIIPNGEFSSDLTISSASGEARYRSSSSVFVPVAGDLTDLSVKRFLEVAS